MNMSKLFQLLEATFQMRINSNAEIIPYIKKLSEMGKFDEPKKIAAIAILLDRVGKLEDEAELEKSLSDIATASNQPTSQPETNPEPSSEITVISETPVIPIIEPSTPSEANPSTVETTVSKFTPENITDPTPSTPDSTTP